MAVDQRPAPPRPRQESWLRADLKRHVSALLLTLAFGLVLAVVAAVAGALGLDIFPIFR